MELKLTYIKAIAEDGNVSKAAARMFLSQPYMSKILHEVEEQYNVQIFNRKTNPMTLTPAGEYIINYINRLEELENDLKADLLRLSQTDNQELTIGITPARGKIMIPIISAAVVDATGLTVSFCEGFHQEVHDKLISGEILFGILNKKICTEPQLVTEKLLNDKLYLILPPNCSFGTEEARGAYENAPLFPEESYAKLNSMTMITYDKTMMLSKMVDRFAKDHRIINSRVITLKNVPTFVEMVAKGQGFCLIPRYAIAHSEFREQLYCYSVPDNYLQTDYVIAWNSTTRLTRKLRAVIDIIRNLWKEQITGTQD